MSCAVGLLRSAIDSRIYIGTIPCDGAFASACAMLLARVPYMDAWRDVLGAMLSACACAFYGCMARVPYMDA